MDESYDGERKFVPFLIAFFVTLLIMAGVFYFLMLMTGGGTPAPAAEEVNLPVTTCLPQSDRRLCALITLSENYDTPPDVFLLAGFLPDKGRLAVCLLPPKTLITAGDGIATLEELFARGGVAYAAKLAGSYFGIDIARSGTMDVRSLTSFMETIGFFEYELTTTLDYPLHQRQVVMPAGRQLLGGRGIMDILAYPAYKGGEKERSDRGAMLLTQMFNYHLPACLSERGDSLCKSFLNNCQTDLSYKDYEERKSAARFLAALELPAATAVYVEGSLNRDYSSFLLTESCLERLHSVYSGESGRPVTPD